MIIKAKEAEQKAIEDGIRENGIEDADKVVQSVLTKRHAQEVRDLEKRFSAEKKVMVK